MRAYKMVFKEKNGVLIQNTENKIEYIDNDGEKRVKTNPTFRDFEKINYLRKKYVSDPPQYDPCTQYLEEVFEKKDGFFEISYIVKEIEVAENEEAN